MTDEEIIIKYEYCKINADARALDCTIVDDKWFLIEHLEIGNVDQNYCF